LWSLIQDYRDYDEQPSDFCYGATATDCWTFATTKENKTPCLVPMIEDDADSCPDGEICASIAPQFATRFTDDGYVISIGAAMVCKVLGESFMRGVIKQSIGLVANILLKIHEHNDSSAMIEKSFICNFTQASTRLLRYREVKETRMVQAMKLQFQSHLSRLVSRLLLLSITTFPF